MNQAAALAFEVSVRPNLPSRGVERTGGLVAQSAVMRDVLLQIVALATSDLPVLFEGGSGAGKSRAARALHLLSGGSVGRPLYVVDLSLEARKLEEVALRAQKSVANLGASANSPEGLGATLLLEGVEALSWERQAVLLRVLDDVVGSDLGGGIRLISTSRRDLGAEVSRGRFRADLYYRLRGAKVRIPSLTERREDISLLADDLLVEAADRRGLPFPGFHPEARIAMRERAWGGNVRQLQAEIEAALEVADLGAPLGAQYFTSMSLDLGHGSLRQVRRGQERNLVLEALESVQWNVSAAARGLGISRVGLSKKMKTLGLVRPAPTPSTPPTSARATGRERETGSAAGRPR